MNRYLLFALLAAGAPLAHAQTVTAPAASAVAPDISRWVNAPGVTLRKDDGTMQIVTVAAASPTAALLLTPEGGQQLLLPDEWNKLALSTPLAPDAPLPLLQIENAVQIVPITQLGADATVQATYTLRSTGPTPLDVKVASTSCGCTGATLDSERLEAGQSTTLRAAMHADDQRLVRVTLSSSEEAAPTRFVALQSKRTFPAFAPPAPVSLFGEKGQIIEARTEFELPQGWTVAKVTAQPDWLQTKWEPIAANGKAGALPRYALAVTAPDSAPEGALQGQVKLELTGAPLQSLSVPIGGFVSNDISATPRLISLKDSPQGIARRIVVVHGPRPFSIRAIRSPMPGFEARFEPTIEAKSHAVELLVPVGGKLGDAFFERAAVELSDGRELALDVMGSVGAGALPNVAENIKLNAPAPAFSGFDVDGNAVSLASLRGHNVVLTFFPHCFTGGCESHLATLRDAYPALQQSGTRVVAVSTDDAQTVAAFARELKLPFAALSDSNREIALAYGAVQNATEAPSRLTFLIDKTGVVRWIDSDVQVKSHGADVLAKIGELGLGAR